MKSKQFYDAQENEPPIKVAQCCQPQQFPSNRAEGGCYNLYITHASPPLLLSILKHTENFRQRAPLCCLASALTASRWAHSLSLPSPAVAPAGTARQGVAPRLISPALFQFRVTRKTKWPETATSQHYYYCLSHLMSGGYASLAARVTPTQHALLSDKRSSASNRSANIDFTFDQTRVESDTSSTRFIC